MDICNYPKRDLFIRIGLKSPCVGYYLRWYYNGWHYWHFLPGEQYVITEGQNYRTTGKKQITLGTGNINLDHVTTIRTLLLTKEIQIYTEKGWVNVFIDPSSLVVYDNEVNGYEVELTITIGSKEISYFSGYSPVLDIPIVDPVPDPDICEIIIGTQIWMCKNYASAFPGSKVYDNDEANRDIYGGLYGSGQITTAGFCPTGWKIPTEAEWQTLITYLGGSAVAGGKLKELGFTHWDAPNTDAADSNSFSGLGGGLYNFLTNTFSDLKQTAYFWTLPDTDINANTIQLKHDDGIALLGSHSGYKQWGFSVRMLKTVAAPIIEIVYGFIYNHYSLSGIGDDAITSDDEWRVVSNADMVALRTFIGGSLNASKIMLTREVPLDDPRWDTINVTLTDDYNFSAAPGDDRYTDGSFPLRPGWCWQMWLSDISGSNAGFCFIAPDYITLPPPVIAMLELSITDFGLYGSRKLGMSVRFARDLRVGENLLSDGTYVDDYVGNDNQRYKAVKINTAVFLAEPLIETKYRDGTSIPEVTSNAAWAALTTGARCSWDNDESYAFRSR